MAHCAAHRAARGTATPVGVTMGEVMNSSSRPIPATRPDRGIQPWLAGLLTGVQAALLSWVCVTVPAVAAFVATAESRVNDGLSWFDASQVGTSLWLVGHGGWATLSSGGRAGVVSLAPLGIALISVLACRVLSRLTTASNWWLIGFGTLGYTAVVAALGVLLASQARASLVGAVVTAVLIGAVGLLWGNASKPEANLLGRLAGTIEATVPEVSAAIRGAGLALAAMTAAAAGLVLAWTIGGRQTFSTILGAYQAGALGGTVLILLSVALVPNLLAYALAYLAGPGFQVGVDTTFNVSATQGGTMPALPVLGLLPQTDPPAAAHAVVLIPVLAGLWAGWIIHRRVASLWWRQGLAALGAAMLGGGALGCLMMLASGALGPGRMSQVGANGLTVGLVAGLELAGGAVLGCLLLPRARGLIKWLGGQVRLNPKEAAGQPEPQG